MTSTVSKQLAAEQLGDLANAQRRQLTLPGGVHAILILVDPKADVAVWNSNIGAGTVKTLMQALAARIDAGVVQVTRSILGR